MNKNKYLLLFSSFGVLILLVAAAVSENFFKEWQSIQAQAKSADGPIDKRLRQVVNPNLKASDRCVTCHVGMAPGEQIASNQAVAAPHKPVVHSPTEIGCTVCHGGQGLATTREDAHGTVEFWTEPMLPAKYAYAGCGTCHTPLGVPNTAVLANARKTFERLDCYACHRLEGRGGTLRVGGNVTGMEGPELSYVGIKGYNQEWYAMHSAKAGSDELWKNAFKEISEPDRAALKTFLDTQMGASKLIVAKAEFNTVGCSGCHKVGSFGGDGGVDLSLSGFKDPNQLNFSNVRGDHTLENWMKQHFRSPVSTVKGSQMPALGLSEERIDLLTMYVLSLRRRTLPDVYLPKDRVRAMRFGAREFVASGEGIYTAVCAACHGEKGQGMRFAGIVPNPSITNPDFLEIASDEFIAQTIAKGRDGRPMLGWTDRENGLTAAEIAGLVAYIRQLGGGIQAQPDPLPRIWAKGDAARGMKLFAASCSGCHGAVGEGNEGPAIGNRLFLESASDTYLYETIVRGRRGTTMQGFGTGSIVRRSLTRDEIEAIIVFLRSLKAK